jgi:NIMA (never in mitosis gene a)-related kinase
MECANGGDLLSKISENNRKRTRFSENDIWHYFVQMASGLKALHEMKIYHRDIKCANLFLTKEKVLKMGDMNVSKVAKAGIASTQTGTPYYASPEVWKDQPYNSSSDIWSLGCVLYEMITGHPPFQATDMGGLAKKIIRGVYPSIPSCYSSDLDSIVKKLLQTNPRLRPSAADILKNQVVKSHAHPELTEEVIDSPGGLLNTIKLPRNL